MSIEQSLTGIGDSSVITRDFTRYDHGYQDKALKYIDYLGALSLALRKFSEYSRTMLASQQLYIYAKWLARYTAYWPELDQLVDRLENSFDEVDQAAEYATSIDWSEIKSLPTWSGSGDWDSLTNEKAVRDKLVEVRSSLLATISDRQNEGINFAKSADSPRFVAVSEFRDPRLVDRTTDQESGKKIDQYLTTLKLRLRTRLDDRRWQSLFSYEKQNIGSFQDWMEKLGVGKRNGPRVSVLDFSMLASEVLPFACALLGRLLLEAREMLRPDTRSQYPWVLVLEEAHNYARPAGKVEDRGQALSRRAFERVAKEGRKFGLSLIVASQRPSEISPTIISQCANFFSHRLQNPDDIDHFRRIIPKQAQRMLDQVTVLAAGEAIVFGSALHVPVRVQIRLPKREPWSATAAPYIDWAKGDAFPLAEVVESWGLKTISESEKSESSQVPDVPSVSTELDDEIPF